MITGEALDIILRIQNLSRFTAGMRAAAGEVRAVGAAARAESAKTGAAVAAMSKKAAVGLAAGATLAAVAGLKASISYSRQMEMIHTQAGASQAEVNRLHNEVLGLAGRELMHGPNQLAEALFHIESVGFRGAEAMRILKMSSYGAMVGQADLGQTASALSSILFSQVKGIRTGIAGADQAMALMNATVGAGNMSMSELVTSLGTGILPAAKVAGLGITDVFGALAELKDQGWGAYGSMAQLATAFHFLYAPTKKATDAMASWGLSQLDISKTMQEQGLPAALELMKTSIERFTGGSVDDPLGRQELAKILPGGRGRVMLVLMNQLDRYRQKIHQIIGTQGNFKESIKKTQEEPAVRLQAAWSRLQAELIRLGDTFKGPATDALVGAMWVLTGLVWVLGEVTDGIGYLDDAWNALPTPIQWSLEYIGLFIGAIAGLWAMSIAVEVLVGVWGALVGAIELAYVALALFALENPVLLGLALLAAALLLIVLHWDDVKQAAKDTWSWIKNHYPLLALAIAGPFGWAAAEIIKHWQEVKDFLGSVPHAFQSVLETVLNFFIDRLNDVIGYLNDAVDIANKVSPFGDIGHIGTIGHVGGSAGGVHGAAKLAGASSRVVPFNTGGATPASARSLRQPRAHVPDPVPLLPDVFSVDAPWILQLDSAVLAKGMARVRANKKARR